MENYVCKTASEDEMNIKWDYEIENSGDERNNWVVWKKENIDRFKSGFIIPYYGILNGRIICEATAMLNPKIVQNSDGLVGNGVVYLSAFRTIKEYQGQGYFSKLFKFMIEDLKRRGYDKVTLGVEPLEEENKKIYNHYGFTEYIKNSTETYPSIKGR